VTRAAFLFARLGQMITIWKLEYYSCDSIIVLLGGMEVKKDASKQGI
jgi:hypothetical protein